MRKDGPEGAPEPQRNPGVHDRFLRYVAAAEHPGVLNRPDGVATGIGSCGDSVAVRLSVTGDVIGDLQVLPRGCIYTAACAGALAVMARGRTLSAALALTPEQLAESLGGLPDDHLHCARLAVNTLGEAIDDYYHRTWGDRGAEKMQNDSARPDPDPGPGAH